MMKANKPRGITKETVGLFHAPDTGAREAAVAAACRGFCEYYRGDEGEEGCSGLMTIIKGVDSGEIGVMQVSHLLDVAPGPARRGGCMSNQMCSVCSYLEGGCDFMAASPPADATPCGGYRLLQALLDAGALAPDVVRGLIQDAER